MGLKVRKVQKVLRDHKVLPEMMVLKDLRVHRVFKVLLVIMD